MRTDFDFGVSWSSDKGLAFRGHASLDATIPVGRSIAGVTLESVHLGLRAADGRLTSDVSMTLRAALGPVKAIVDRVGIEALVTFPEDGGNVGVAQVDLGIKPPTGIGLLVDAKGVVTGGGMLFFDPDAHLYGGALSSSIHEAITGQAFGLITTRLPDGRRGYLILVFITVEDFQPIQLGIGFFARRHRRTRRDQSHLQRRCAPRGDDARHDRHAALPERSGHQRTGDYPGARRRVSGAPGGATCSVCSLGSPGSCRRW